MKKRGILIGVCILGLLLIPVAGLTLAEDLEPRWLLAPQAEMGTAFTYQGKLEDGGSLVNGNCDFQFSLYDASGGGAQISSTQTKTNVGVSDGLFTVQLDFGSGAFNGEARWLEIGVRCPTGSGSYTTLTQRQGLTPSPYALALPGLWTRQNATSPNLIGGYHGNSVMGGVVGATIGGGGDSAGSHYVNGSYGTISGGYDNGVSANQATVAGGKQNYASGWAAAVGGGWDNRASGSNAIVGGGRSNRATNTSATVSGGCYNLAEGEYATIAGGGPANIGDLANTSNRVYDDYGTIGGGGGNRVGSDDSDTTNTTYATVGGGHNNTATGRSTTIGGGYGNQATAYYATVGGGHDNTASGERATVGGGYDNTASGNYATVPGGNYNSASGEYSFAAGTWANASHDGAFVWSGGGFTSADSWGDETFTARAHGGVRFYSASGTTMGVQLSSGGTSWGVISDRNAKENFADVDADRLLDTLAEMDVQTWNLKAQSQEMRHVGPVAQDFNGKFGYLFGEVESPVHINTMDAVGVSLAAARGLYKRSQEQAARIEELETENAALQQQLDGLETRLAALEGRSGFAEEARSAGFGQAALLRWVGLLLAAVGLAVVVAIRRKEERR